MKLTFNHERLLAVIAHPDDAEMLCAGTLARAKQGGAAIAVCVLCRGDKGQSSRAVADLATVRWREMQAAARLLGAKLYRGGFPDGQLYDGPAGRRKLVEIYRLFQPTLVLAHAPEDYHPDHRAASALAEAASWFCASRGHKTPSAPLATPPALWWMDTIGMHEFSPDFYVDISPYTALKERMLACHQSQLQRGQDADFSPLLDLMQLQCHTRGLQSHVAAAEAFRLPHRFKRLRAW